MRRDFLKAIGLGAAGFVAGSLPTVAGPFEGADFEQLVPADKKLDPSWVRSLFDRGERRAYRGRELDHLGLPIGGVCAGQVYLGGDGRLWLWDIFNENRRTRWDGTHYRDPMSPDARLEQGFALAVQQGDTVRIRRLRREDFADTTFYGEYPVGTVEFRDPALPVAVTLEAFSPFIPLNVPDSSLPAIVMRFTVKNTSGAEVGITLGGWLENAICSRGAAGAPGTRHNRITRPQHLTLLDCSVEAPYEPAGRRDPRPDVVFADFETETHAGWTATGNAFGRGPTAVAEVPGYQGDLAGQGSRLVNSHAAAPGTEVAQKDAATGTLTSAGFVLERDFVNIRIGGGNHPGQTCVNLLLDGKAVLSATGRNENRMRPHTFDVRPWAGRRAQLQIVDQATGGWGNIGVDHIVFSDTPAVAPTRLQDRPDFGTMTLGLLQAEGTTAGGDSGWPMLEPEAPASSLLQGPTGANDKERACALDSRLVGGLTRRVKVAPGQSATVAFVVTWHFPHARLDEFQQPVGRHYATRFDSAAAVAAYVAANATRLWEETRRWRDTWYDSTLPYWFLDRTFINTSILATTTCYRFADGRFYGWEGVGCCPGTCLHVWQYAQAIARVFPELERDTRERVDFGLSFRPDSGIIGYRGPEVSLDPAVDGQAGTILRTYREHQMSANDAFLRRNWPRIRMAIEWLTTLDTNRDGILDRPQYNTLDDAWHGEIAWISSLYVAALRAGEAMAIEMGDREFAERCAALATRGARAIGERLFNGEYFFHRGDPQQPDSPGSYGGCEIDQVFGQSYAWQVGLGRILDADQVQRALRALWRYNFTPDIGPYRQAFPKGRWYALAGEGGLLMCTFPKGDSDSLGKGNETFASYFNECMTGFEYQVAGHMIWENMLLEGLAITRMIHDRYHPLRRNPFNEIECGDHYARAMASYGVYLAACGYRYHGPRGELAFAPRLNPERFRCAYTTAEGWGTFSQATDANQHRAELALQWGHLRLHRLELGLSPGWVPQTAHVRLENTAIRATLSVVDALAALTFEAPVDLKAGQSMSIALA